MNCRSGCTGPAPGGSQLPKKPSEPTPYTASELRQMLRDRQGALTLGQFSAEIGISLQFLSQIYLGDRSVGNELVLRYLAPRGKMFVAETVWHLRDE